jgi:outer membrane lipoprotein-sorting protein
MRCKRAALVLVGLIAGLILPRASADDARTIVEQAIKAHGGADKLARMSVGTWKVKGVLNALGMKVPYTGEYAFQMPDKFRMSFKMEFGGQGVDMVVVTDGKQAWEKAAGQVQEMPREKYNEFQHQVYVMNLSQLAPLLDKSHTLTSLGESKLGDKTVVGIKVAKPGKRDVAMFFDKDTMLLTKTSTRVMDEFTMKEAIQEVVMTGHRDIGGLKCFDKLTILRDGKPFVEEEFSDQRFLDKPDPKLFEKP